MRDLSTPTQDGDVVLGDDWVAPDNTGSDELRARRERRGLFSLRGSPLTRKIITFNLIALNVLVAGILYLNSSRDSLAVQRAASLVAEAELIADVIEAKLPEGQPVNLATGTGVDVPEALAAIDLRGGIDVFVFDPSEVLVAQSQNGLGAGSDAAEGNSPTLLTDGLSWVWNRISGAFGIGSGGEAVALEEKFMPLIASTLENGTRTDNTLDGDGGTLLTVLTPIMQGDTAVGVVAIASAAGEIDNLVRSERERVLQMFVIATVVSIGLSLVLASTIANPLADLAAAAELSRDKNSRKVIWAHPYPGSHRPPG